MRTEFSTLDIGKALDIPRERLRDWMNRGFASPTVLAAGQGTKAVFTRNDVYMIAIFKSLIEIGLSRTVASKYINIISLEENLGICRKEKAYIIFRTSIKDGKPDIRSIDWEPGEEPDRCVIDFATGNVVESMDSDTASIGGDKNWRIIHIMNFRTLRKEVDAALARP